jgi:hypothetical protein
MVVRMPLRGLVFVLVELVLALEIRLTLVELGRQVVLQLVLVLLAVEPGLLLAVEPGLLLPLVL